MIWSFLISLYFFYNILCSLAFSKESSSLSQGGPTSISAGWQVVMNFHKFKKDSQKYFPITLPHPSLVAFTVDLLTQWTFFKTDWVEESWVISCPHCPIDHCGTEFSSGCWLSSNSAQISTSSALPSWHAVRGRLIFPSLPQVDSSTQTDESIS